MHGPESRPRTLLDRVEFLGNLLPEPSLIFAGIAVVVAVLSALGAALGWGVQPVEARVVMTQVVGADGAITHAPKVDPATGREEVRLEPKGDYLKVRSLLTRDGVYWAMSSMVRNFMAFPPLGMVLVSMLGIGVVERVGLFAVCMRWLAGRTPRSLLTPVVLFLGINSAIAGDSGWIVLPALAAGLFAVTGRHPLAGLAAACAGVSMGFGSGLFIHAADTVVAGVGSKAAQLLDVHSGVDVTANLWFKMVSVPVLVGAGWAITDRWVEPRLNRNVRVDAGPEGSDGHRAVTAQESRAMGWALLSACAVLCVFAALVFIPGAPLHGAGQPTLADGQPGPERPGARWSHVIVPMMFAVFVTPGLVYGKLAGTLRGKGEIAAAFTDAVKSIAPIVVMAFFAAQALAYFDYSNLSKVLAFGGGRALVESGLPVPALLVLFTLFVITIDVVMSSMTAKFTLLAPVVVPMFMMVGMSPGLTTAAYRIGDCTVNASSPLNAYLAVVLLVQQKYQKSAGMGSVISLMLPYSVVFGVVWITVLLAWYASGMPLGIGAGGELHYVPVR